MPALSLVFAGTSEFGAAQLNALQGDGSCQVSAVYTQPDRPAGRGQTLRSSPVKRLALAQGLPLYQPHNLQGDADLEKLSALEPELIVVAAYGMLLPSAWLALPRYGGINVHCSLLPRWRGAAPVQRAIAAGDRQTGVTIMQMDAGLDTGDILAQRPCTIGDDENAGELESRLAALGAGALLKVVSALAQGTLPVARAQDDRHSCLAPKIHREETWLDWTQTATTLARQVRALSPAPGARLHTGTQLIKLWRAEALPGAAKAPPGPVLPASGGAARERLEVACGQGVLRLLGLQLPGRRTLHSADFLNGHAKLLPPGLRLASCTP